MRMVTPYRYWIPCHAWREESGQFLVEMNGHFYLSDTTIGRIMSIGQVNLEISNDNVVHFLEDLHRHCPIRLGRLVNGNPSRIMIGLRNWRERSTTCNVNFKYCNSLTAQPIKAHQHDATFQPPRH